MRTVFVLLSLLLGVSGARAGALVDAFSGHPVVVYTFYALQPNCLPMPMSVIHLEPIAQPRHGHLLWANAMVPTRYPASNPRHVCNDVARHGLHLLYQANAGYKGSDNFTVQITFPAGATQTVSRPVEVR